MHGTIAFRVDWSTRIGLGHLQRCRSLIDALALRQLDGLLVTGAQSLAEGRSGTAPAPATIRLPAEPPSSAASGAASAAGSRARNRDVEELLPAEAQLHDAGATVAALRGRQVRAVVVDHYGLDATWESHVRAQLGVPVAAIDGLARRRHIAEVVIDPADVRDDTGRWAGLVPPGTRLLRGPRFAPVAPSFQDALARRPHRDGQLRRLLVSFGGSDPHGLTHRSLDALEYLPHHDLSVDVVVGAGYREPAAVEARCARLPWARFHHATSQMAQLMAAADLAIGAGGMTIYERAFLGLPAIVVVTASNQAQQVAEVASAGAIRVLGTAAEVAAADLAAALAALDAEPAQVRRMSQDARRLMGQETVPGSLLVADEIRAVL